MCRWNELQPEGQGLLADFDVYFKALSNANKEVCTLTLTATLHLISCYFAQPFKKEMCHSECIGVFSSYCS